MPFIKMPDGTVAHIRMAKQRVKSCRVPVDGKLCRRKPAEWLCDGCDTPLCIECKVTVKPKGKVRDFCSVCFESQWRMWLAERTVFILADRATQRAERRRLFRLWATNHPEVFESIPLSAATLAEEKT